MALLVVASARLTIFVRQRAATDYDTVDASAAVTAAATTLVVAILLTRVQSWRFPSKARITAIGALHSYFALGAASALWSSNPPFTFYRAVEVWALSTAAMQCIISAHSQERAETLFLRFTLFVSLASLTQHLLRPGFSVSTLHTNVYSYTGALLAVYSDAESRSGSPMRNKKMRRYRAIGLILTVIGTSIASNLALIAGAFSSRILQKGGTATLMIAIFVPAIAAGSGLGETILENSVLAGRDIDSVATLTGRTSLWSQYAEQVASRPALGVGLAVGTRKSIKLDGISTTNAHNGLIDAALGTGLVGLSLLALALALSFRYATSLAMHGIKGGPGLLAGVVTFLVNNMSKTILGGALDVTTLPTVMLFALTLRLRRTQ